jgi:hypothetical protein
MLEGQVIYRDFFQFTLPGTELVYFALFKLLGPRAWVPNVMLLVLGLSLTWLSIVISRKVIRGRAVYLPGLLFLTFSLYSRLDATHHWYSLLPVMGAIALLIEKRTCARLAVAGLLFGFASFFTQVRGLVAVVGLVVFLVWEHRRTASSRLAVLRAQACLVGTFLGTLVATNAYFAWKAGLRRFLECTVIFGIRYHGAYSAANSLKTYLFSPPPVRPWYGLPWLVVYLFVHLLLPLVYFLFFGRHWRAARSHPEHAWNELMLLSIVGLSLFLGVAPAPSFGRLSPVALPALILFVWFVTLPGKPERILSRLVWGFVLLMSVLDPMRVQRHPKSYLDLPSGRAAFLDPIVYERYKWIAEHTRRSDFFFQGDWADTYVALGLRNPTPVPFVTNTGYTRPAQVQEVIEALERQRVQLVLWSLDLDMPQRVPGAIDHLSPLRAYLRGRYRVVKTFADGDQVWQRRYRRSFASGPSAVCFKGPTKIRHHLDPEPNRYIL